MPAPHPPEFRQRAVELARRGDAPVAKIAKDLSISESCLRNWMAQADADENGSESRLTSAERKELAQLRRDKKRLEMEVEILKRAAAYFARENVLPNWPTGWSVSSSTTRSSTWMPRSRAGF
ncbi:MAG: transposase [Frankia sp.]|nr:transposase [Frankia sp.]